MLLVLESGGRIAASHGTRVNGVSTLQQCDLFALPGDERSGCPKRPSWAITAARVIDDPSSTSESVRGRPPAALRDQPPAAADLQHPARQRRGASGFLVPDIEVSSRNGFELGVPYHWQIAPNRDLTITPHVYTAVFPRSTLKYRELNSLGRVPGRRLPTYGNDRQCEPRPATTTDRNRLARLFRCQRQVAARPRLEHHASLRGCDRQDLHPPLRHHQRRPAAKRGQCRADPADSYISIAGWAFQGLRADDRQKQIPIALPAIDARFRMDDIAGGKLEIQGNSLAIIRIEGQDTQRAFASVRWDLRRLTPWGQEVTLHRLRPRRRLPHRRCRRRRPCAIYQGTDGWHARAIGALAADVKWPFVGPAVRRHADASRRESSSSLTPPTPNLRHPERGCALGRSRGQQPVRAQPLPRLRPLGRCVARHLWRRLVARPRQSLDRKRRSARAFGSDGCTDIFPEGTGLDGPVFRHRRKNPQSATAGSSTSLTVTGIDKSNFAVRRNEVDLTVGTDPDLCADRLPASSTATSILRSRTCATSRSCGSAARVAFTRYWSVFGSTVIDLTDKSEDPTSLAEWFSAGPPPPRHPVRGRLLTAWRDVAARL